MVLLGVTGSGKSATCNTLSDSSHFKVSGSCESETDKVSGLVCRWRGQNQGAEKDKGFPFIIMDTPGFGDSKGRDTSHIAEMVT